MRPLDLDLRCGEYVPRERLDAAQAAWRRVVFSGRARWPFELAGARYTLCFVDEPPIRHADVAILWRLGRERAWLGLESADGLAASTPMHPWLASRHTPAALAQALLVEHCAPLLKALGRAFAQPVEVLEIRRSHWLVRSAASQAIRIVAGDDGIAVRAALASDSSGLWQHLAAVLRRRAVPVRADMPVRAVLALAPVPLEVGELPRVGVGDVLLFARSGGLESVSAWVVDYRWRAVAGVLLTGRRGRVHCSSSKESLMQFDPALLSEMAGEPALMQATVAITAVLTEVELPWHSLDAVDPGYVFELPCELDRVVVRLYAGRHPVGEGRLVAIENKLGVCVTRWDGGASK